MNRIRTTIFAAVAGFTALAATPVAAQAPPPGTACNARSEVVRVLTERFQEFRVGAGLQGNGLILEVFASRSGTWSVVLSWPTGLSCIVASGEAWMNVASGPEDPAA